MVTHAAGLLLLLREERDSTPELARTLDLHIALSGARAEVAPKVAAGWAERAQARLKHGEAALDIDQLDLDWEAVTRLAREVCRIAAHHEVELAEAFARIASRLDVDAVDEDVMRAMAVEYLAGGKTGWNEDLDHELFGFVLNQALRPFLQAYAAASAPLLEGERWDRGNCPVCGGHPDFAALEGEGGERRLLCGRCDMEWKYQRLGCPFCGNEDSRSLGYFPAGNGAHRLYVCEQCKGYLKTVDLRETWRRRPLTIERILTVGMDLAAAEQGYCRR